MNKAATAGLCPHCKTALNPGATACAGCGAFETTRWGDLGAWKTSLLVICIVIPPLISVLIVFISPRAALVFFVACWVGYFLIRFRLKRKVIWAVGGRRVM